jgi:hypothetical protein
MSNEKPSGDSSRRHFLSAAAVVSAAVAAPTAAKAQALTAPRKPVGIKRKRGNDEITTPDFALAPDAVPGIAQVIVDIWQQTKPNLDKIISDRVNGFAGPTAVKQATDAINAAFPNYNFARVVIISEEEHDNGYLMEKTNEVVFVLPDPSRIVAGANLLNSAKLLMACTPNGI